MRDGTLQRDREEAGGSVRKRAPLQGVGWLTDEGPADGALPLAVQHAEAADVGARGHTSVAPAQHPGHVGPVAVALAGLVRAGFTPRPIASKQVRNTATSSPSHLVPCASHQLNPAAE